MDTVKVFKNRGKGRIRRRGGGEFEKKIANVTNGISKLVEKLKIHDYGLTDVENTRYSLKRLSLKLRNFYSKRNFDTELEIGSVGIPEISPYTKSEQPTVAGQHITRHAKYRYAAVGI